MSSDGLYIQMFSIHGLVRSNNIEMGRDADTGGQVKYVLELAETLGRQEGVDRVDLFTRLIDDNKVSSDYSRPEEFIDDNVRIVRIKCGGTTYRRKELLWPYLNEFVDRVVTYTRKQDRMPDFVHGHYADAGYVALSLADLFGIPFIFTGHSLGRVKQQKLLNDGMGEEAIESRYNMESRIGAEEASIEKAALVVTSTSQEVTSQYGMYENREKTEYRVIPPGVDLTRFYPYYEDALTDEGKKILESRQARAFLLEELNRFFMNSDKPLILSLCRPDKRKNIQGLIQAYGENRELQAIANLAVFAGIRKDISKMGENEKEVLTDMLLLMDKYDLYGKMAIPKTHNFTYDVPELYRITAASKGVFVNPALTEPFGLTLIESAGCGLPIVCTNDGGPVDIVANCANGSLIDVSNTGEMAEAIKSIIVDPERWKNLSTSGIRGVGKHYTWEAHCRTYLETLNSLSVAGVDGEAARARGAEALGRRLEGLDSMIVTDIDNTLTGDDEAMRELFGLLEKHRDSLCFCLATGRSVDSTLDLLAEMRLPFPDILISSVGSEIHYMRSLIEDKGWASHISYRWEREEIVDMLTQLDFLELQEHENQREFKVSYYMPPQPDRLEYIEELGKKHGMRFSIVYSHQSYLDILPCRASKGKAVAYLSKKWNIPADNIVVCGDSGNDEEMMQGKFNGVVVANYSSEMEKLKGRDKVYFSPHRHAAGIIDGIRHYGLLDARRKKRRPPGEGGKISTLAL